MNDKSCALCNKDDHACVFCLAIVLCLSLIKTLKTLGQVMLMPSLRRNLDIPEAQFPVVEVVKFDTW